MNDLFHLHSTYLTLLRRRLKWIQSKTSESTATNHLEIVALVIDILSNIDSLSVIHNDLLQEMP
jgi:hypothetical protein